MKKEIEKTLSVLIGLPFRNSGRSADLQWFDFGSQLIKVPTRNGGETLEGAYVLDTESAWHIAGPEGIIVGSRDRLYPAGEDPYKDLLEFDWDRPGVNRCDERIKKLLDERKENLLLVKFIEADNWGGLKLYFFDGYILEIFPDNSLGSEYWRFFGTSKSTPHFVVSGKGINAE